MKTFYFIRDNRYTIGMIVITLAVVASVIYNATIHGI